MRRRRSGEKSTRAEKTDGLLKCRNRRARDEETGSLLAVLPLTRAELCLKCLKHLLHNLPLLLHKVLLNPRRDRRHRLPARIPDLRPSREELLKPWKGKQVRAGVFGLVLREEDRGGGGKGGEGGGEGGVGEGGDLLRVRKR